MTTETFPPLYSRLDPEMTARTRRRFEEAKATKTQSAIEYILFAVFGTTILIAAIALVVTNTASFRRVPNSVAAGIAADRVNILVIDTVRNAADRTVDVEALMLLSIKPSTRAVAVTSIPRELMLKLGKYGERRLGTALAVGKSAGYPGEGTGLTADTIQGAFGQQVHAYVTLDRVDLVKAVNAVGGIDINVPQNFYEARHRDRFTRGYRHLDGPQAMRYALSTHVLGPANQWVAREARQQQVLAALAAKATASTNIERLAWLTPGERTNLTADQIALVGRWIGGTEPRRVTLAPYMDTYEVTTFADDGEAVRPRNGDYAPVRAVIANVFAPATAMTTN